MTRCFSDDEPTTRMRRAPRDRPGGAAFAGDGGGESTATRGDAVHQLELRMGPPKQKQAFCASSSSWSSSPKLDSDPSCESAWGRARWAAIWQFEVEAARVETSSWGDEATLTRTLALR